MEMNLTPLPAATPNTPAVSVYASLPPEVQAQLRGTAEAIRSSRGRLISEVMAIGEALLKVKVVLEHGKFSRWIAAEFGWSERSAQNYMRAYEAFGSNSQRVADLPLTQVYKLAALTAESRDRVFDTASKEVKISSLIAQETWTAKQAAALAAEEARKAALSPEARKAEEERAKRQRRARVKKDEAWAADEAKRKVEQEKEKASAGKALDLLREEMPDRFDEFLKLVHASSYHFLGQVRQLLLGPHPSLMHRGRGGSE